MWTSRHAVRGCQAAQAQVGCSLSHFFERRVSAYHVAVSGTISFDEEV